jgi:acetoacetyl-CoA synthetase
MDRFGQIEPRVLFCVERYRYAGKEIDLRARITDVVSRIPAIERVVVVPYSGGLADISGITRAQSYEDFAGAPSDAEITFTRLAFDHPLYILYSSGTTGLPKCLVHGGGGTLLQHLKGHRLHADLKPGDLLFYFTP